MGDIQVLVIPFDGSGQLSHFVVAPFQSIAAQRRLYARLLDFCDVSAEFYLQRGKRGWEAELLQFIHHALRNQQSPLPFFC